MGFSLVKGHILMPRKTAWWILLPYCVEHMTAKICVHIYMTLSFVWIYITIIFCNHFDIIIMYPENMTWPSLLCVVLMNKFTPNNVLINISTIPKFDIYIWCLKKTLPIMATHYVISIINVRCAHMWMSMMEEQENKSIIDGYYWWINVILQATINLHSSQWSFRFNSYVEDSLAVWEQLVQQLSFGSFGFWCQLVSQSTGSRSRYREETEMEVQGWGSASWLERSLLFY